MAAAMLSVTDFYALEFYQKAIYYYSTDCTDCTDFFRSCNVL